MNTPTGRFNLRTRKSLKLNGQIECTSCHRYYFAPEIFDVENDDCDDPTKTNGGEKLCCDCEEKKQLEPPPKRRAVQRQNVASSPISKTTPMTTKIKQEQIDLDYSPATDNGHFDRVSTIANRTATTNGISQNGMVQIHSSELLTQPMLTMNINRKYTTTVVDDFKMWWNCCPKPRVMENFQFFYLSKLPINSTSKKKTSAPQRTRSSETVDLNELNESESAQSNVMNHKTKWTHQTKTKIKFVWKLKQP